MIDFVGNITLNSSGTAAVIAANTVTIENGVVVTIAGFNFGKRIYQRCELQRASTAVTTKTTGTFAGGANHPQPLGRPPPFDSPSARLAAKQTQSARSGGGIGHTIHITDSSQLGSLLENASPGRDGKVRIASAAIPRTASAGKAPAQTSRVANARDRHRSVDMNVGSKMVASRLP